MINRMEFIEKPKKKIGFKKFYILLQSQKICLVA